MGPACAAPVLSPRAATACVRRFLSPRKRHSLRRVHSSRDVVPGMKDLWCGRMGARALGDLWHVPAHVVPCCLASAPAVPWYQNAPRLGATRPPLPEFPPVSLGTWSLS